MYLKVLEAKHPAKITCNMFIQDGTFTSVFVTTAMNILVHFCFGFMSCYIQILSVHSMFSVMSTVTFLFFFFCLNSF